MCALLIGEVAARANVATATIRYYESIGLLEPSMRSASGYRRYTERTVDELRFIKKGQALGFSLDELGEILTLSRSGVAPCVHVLSVGHRHLDAIEARLQQLQLFRNQLRAELAKWDQQPTGVTCEGLCRFIAEAAPELTDTTTPSNRRGLRSTSHRSARRDKG